MIRRNKYFESYMKIFLIQRKIKILM